MFLLVGMWGSLSRFVSFECQTHGWRFWDWRLESPVTKVAWFDVSPQSNFINSDSWELSNLTSALKHVSISMIVKNITKTRVFTCFHFQNCWILESPTRFHTQKYLGFSNGWLQARGGKRPLLAPSVFQRRRPQRGPLVLLSNVPGGWQLATELELWNLFFRKKKLEKRSDMLFLNWLLDSWRRFWLIFDSISWFSLDFWCSLFFFEVKTFHRLFRWSQQKTQVAYQNAQLLEDVPLSDVDVTGPRDVDVEPRGSRLTQWKKVLIHVRYL